MGYVLKIQSFCLNDGPGIRTTVFFQGCNLRCFWCHNPESQSMKPIPLFNPAKCIGCGACAEVCPRAKDGKTALFTKDCLLCGKCVQECFSGALEMSSTQMQPQELFKKLLPEKSLFAESGGGVTFSGGEPMMQPEFLLEMLRLCKREEIHTAVDSALHVDFSVIKKLMPYVDLWLCDLKSIRSQNHQKGVGVGNERILENIRKLNQSGADMIIRMPIIPGFNDSREEMTEVCRYLHTLDHIPPVNLLPFHNWCENKYHLLGRDFSAAQIAPPTEEHMKELREIFIQSGIQNVQLNG